ncbi:MAG TPA: 3-isopropylmalate dehydratase, partial [Bacillota bacterium]
DPDTLTPHLFENLRPGIHDRLPGAIVVGGVNFGAGSTREIVPILLKKVGVQVVAAKSFSRGFFRNAVNLGLAVAEVDTTGFTDGDVIEVDFDQGTVVNHTRGIERAFKPLPKIMQEILRAGGLVPYFRIHRSFG